MAQWTKVTTKSELAPGKCKAAEVNGRNLAIYNVNGTFYVTDNTCAHQGGPLGEGLLQGSVITCPWHAWQFDVTNGESVFDSETKVATFAVRIDDNDVLVDL